MIESTDELLAQRFCQDSDRKALSELILRHQSRIYSYLLRILKNPHDAEEAAQECFLRMMRGLAGFNRELPFRPWLYTIALNCARTKAVRNREQTERERSAPPGGGPKPTMNPLDAALRNEVLELMDQLPQSQKEAMTLHYCQGLSHSEVATVLEAPAGTVATWIHSGLQSLRGRPGGRGGGTPDRSRPALGGRGDGPVDDSFVRSQLGSLLRPFGRVRSRGPPSRRYPRDQG